jgi:hypothetical protein
MVGALIFVIATWTVPPSPVVEHREVLETTVGMEGVYYLRFQGPALEAKPVDENAPVVARVADVVKDGQSTLYELRYIGMRPGTFDLREFFERVDGEKLAGMAPISITVRAVLPANHNGQLEELAPPRVSPAWRYRLAIAAVGVLWLVPVVCVAVRRVVRHRPQLKAAPEAEPTLADQLRPLVEAALSGALSTEDQARLELLLIAHWRERLDLAGCTTAEALVRLREYPESAQLLVQLEHWLHEPTGRHPVDLAGLLRPYGNQPAVDLGAVKPQEATP